MLSWAVGVPVALRSGGRLATTLVAAINNIILLPFFSYVASSTFLIEGVLGSKTYFAKVDGSAHKPKGWHLLRPLGPFRAPLAAILDFAGGAVFQAVSQCPRCRWAGIPPPNCNNNIFTYGPYMWVLFLKKGKLFEIIVSWSLGHLQILAQFFRGHFVLCQALE